MYNIDEVNGMTYAELIRFLKKNGCILSSHNSNHDMYYSPITGKRFPVGRHIKQEVRPGTLNCILLQAGLKNKK